jgi:holliday junction DNA helicase RuvB
MSDINPNRIRTPGIEESAPAPARGGAGPFIPDSLAGHPSGRGAVEGEPVRVDAEVRVHDARADPPDEDLDRSLRPPTLADFVNQAQVTEQLAIFIEAARGRGEPLDHVLLAGPPGLGKTSLAHIVAAEMGVPMVQTAGPALERKADVASFLTALEPGSVFFIDEIHRLGRAVEETLYPAMEDGELPVVLGQGAGARTVTLPLPPFTLVGATTRAGLLTTPLRDRFGVCHRLEHYSPEHLAAIVERSAGIIGVEIEAEGARTIATRSRGTPRVANRLLKRVRDFAQVKGSTTIDAAAAVAGLEMLEVDGWGLDRSDRALLETVATKFAGGPVGLSTLAVAIGEEQDTIEDVLEPYLLQQGLLKRTPRGRVLTQRAYDHLGLPAPEGAASLF